MFIKHSDALLDFFPGGGGLSALEYQRIHITERKRISEISTIYVERTRLQNREGNAAELLKGKA